MGVDTVGLVVNLVFYGAIVITGILAARVFNITGGVSDFTESSMVAGRNLGLFLGIFTMSATSVGGGFLSSTVEGAATLGLAWTIFPFTILIAFTLGSLVFAKPMREKKYITVLDPLQERYGDVMTGLILVAALMAELLWGATILLSLGTNLSVIIDLDINVAMVVSACVAVVYTIFGQMVAVACTDVMQFLLVVFGMILCVPFILTDDKMGSLGDSKDVWVGSIDGRYAPMWCDFFVAQVLGGIPWNTYIMRILSAKSVWHAQVISVVGGLISLVMAVPPFLIGAASTAADWNATDYGENPVPDDVTRLMPLVIDNFTPRAIALITLSAVAAAVMSSMDSIILSSSCMFTRNIYQLALRPQAGKNELRIVQATSMLGVATVSLLLAVFVDSIFGMFVLTADIMYIAVFPQFVCAIFVPWANVYGSFVGYCISVVLRFGAGEPTIDLNHFIEYPRYDDLEGQLFPYRTLAMLAGVVSIITVSYITNWLFVTGRLPSKWDISKKVTHIDLNDNYSKSDIDTDAKDRVTSDVKFGEIGEINPAYVETENTMSSPL